MKYRNIGQSDLSVSPIGIGGNIFGYLLDEDQTKNLLHYSLDRGINFIDTADVYSDGISEILIAKATARYRDKWIIASKVGLKTDAPSAGLGKKKNIKEKVEKSLVRLKTDYIDLYQLHHFDPDTPIEETLDAFDELVDEGKIRYAGCSNFTFEELKRSHDISQINQLHKFISIQINYNLLKRECEEELLPFCEKQKTGVLIYGALGRGVLTDKYLFGKQNTEAYIPRANISKKIRSDLTPEILDLVQRLNDYAVHELGTDLQTMAISWLIRKKMISSVILGMRSVQQVESNLAVLQTTLNVGNINAIDKIIGDPEIYKSLSLGGLIN